jgi:hypothetical protein
MHAPILQHGVWRWQLIEKAHDITRPTPHHGEPPFRPRSATNTPSLVCSLAGTPSRDRATPRTVHLHLSPTHPLSLEPLSKGPPALRLWRRRCHCFAVHDVDFFVWEDFYGRETKRWRIARPVFRFRTSKLQATATDSTYAVFLFSTIIVTLLHFSSIHNGTNHGNHLAGSTESKLDLKFQ